MMKKTLLFLLIVSLISCNNDKDELELYPDGLKKRVFVSGWDIDTYGSDSIVEYYEEKLIRRAEKYIRYRDELNPMYLTYDFDSNMLLTHVNYHNDIDMTDLFATNTYVYDENLRIQKIEWKKIKASSLNDILSHHTTFYEYQGDTVRTYRIDHNKGTRDREGTWVIMGNLDSIKNVASNRMSIYNDQNDIIHTKYLGDPEDVYSWYTEYSYGNAKEPLMHNFFGNRLNLFLIPNPIRYYHLELTSRYLERSVSLDHRTNEFFSYSYMLDAKNRPLEMRRRYGDVITYFYN